jgi:acyl dehydratase
MNRITQSTEPGEKIIGPLKILTLERMRVFSGWPNKNIHTDVDVARKCGLAAPIASGAMFEGYLTDMMLELFGDDWLYYGKMEVIFLKPVYAGSSVQLMAVVKSKINEGHKEKFNLEIWGENQQGERFFTGFCTGLVPSASSK